MKNWHSILIVILHDKMIFSQFGTHLNLKRYKLYDEKDFRTLFFRFSLLLMTSKKSLFRKEKSIILKLNKEKNSITLLLFNTSKRKS